MLVTPIWCTNNVLISKSVNKHVHTLWHISHRNDVITLLTHNKWLQWMATVLRRNLSVNMLLYHIARQQDCAEVECELIIIIQSGLLYGTARSIGVRCSYLKPRHVYHNLVLQSP